MPLNLLIDRIYYCTCLFCTDKYIYKSHQTHVFDYEKQFLSKDSYNMLLTL